jgi:hypothetical protein
MESLITYESETVTQWTSFFSTPPYSKNYGCGHSPAPNPFPTQFLTLLKSLVAGKHLASKSLLPGLLAGKKFFRVRVSKFLVYPKFSLD